MVCTGHNLNRAAAIFDFTIQACVQTHLNPNSNMWQLSLSGHHWPLTGRHQLAAHVYAPHPQYEAANHV
jgi:hypothetical protein